MIPLRLELKNFLAYRSPDPLRFDGIHLACLTGANGAGKSSLLDAVTWALWGKARAKRDDDLIHLGQNEMHVQLDFLQEELTYRVVRKRARRAKSSTGEVSLLGWDEAGNSWNLINEGSVRETQEKINRILRLDYETFVNSAFLQQGKADAFTTKPPAQRKQILADILGLAQWENYEEAAKARLKSIADDLLSTESRIHEIERDLHKEAGFRKVLADAQRAQHEALEALAAAEAHLNEVAGAPAALRAAQERKADAERARRDREKELSALHNEINRQQSRLADFQAIIDARADIEGGYAALQAARAADSELADKLYQLNQVENQRHALEGQLRDARAALENEISAISARQGELRAALTLADPDELEVVQSQVVSLQSVQAQRDSLNEQHQHLSEEKAGLDSDLKTLEQAGKNIRERLERLNATTDPNCPLCGQPLDEAHRQELVAQLSAEIEARRAEYAERQKRVKEINGERNEAKKQANALEKELGQLQPLLEQAAVLQAHIGAAENAQLRLNEESEHLEALHRALADGQYGLDVQAALVDLETQQNTLGYDRTSHDTARQQLKAYQTYETRQKQLDLAVSSLPDVQEALANADARFQRLSDALREDKEKLTALEGEIAQLAVMAQEEKRRRDEVNSQRTAERNAHQRLTIAQQELNALEGQRQRKAELEARRESKRIEQTRYDELKRAFGKNGVPAMLIEAAIPELEEDSNELLAQMTGGRMSLHFSTQREKTSSEGVIETLEIEIADELGTRSYEMYSGGEAFRINFAVRVALSQLLARRAGAQLRTLFIDEGFGTQDEDGRNRLVEAITAVQDRFDLILVITHMDDLRDSFPVHVVVQKTPSGSRISVR